MPSQWGRQPKGNDSWTLVLWVVIIGIIGYFVIPNFFKSTNTDNQTEAATSLTNLNSSSSYYPNTITSNNTSSQLFPDTNNTLTNGGGNNVMASGYWILYVSNGTSQQLSLNTQDYSFFETLIQSDSNGNSATTVFLVDNGQIHQYKVSNEVYSIITNMATINSRATSNSGESDVSKTGQSTSLSETLTVSNPSTNGFTVAFNPALNNLNTSSFILTNSAGNSVPITDVKTSDNGATYTICATLNSGQSYTITAKYPGYSFGAGQNVIIPSPAAGGITSTTSSGAISETLTVSNPSTSGFTAAFNPALNGLALSNFTLVNNLGNPVTITDVKTSDNGASYIISANLSSGQTYTLTVADTGYTFGTPQNISIP